VADAQHHAAGSRACGAKGRISIGAHAWFSSRGNRKNKTRWLVAYRVSLNSGGRASGWNGSREAVLRHTTHTTRAANPPRRCGSSMRLARVARSGSASWGRKANTPIERRQRWRCAFAAMPARDVRFEDGRWASVASSAGGGAIEITPAAWPNRHHERPSVASSSRSTPTPRHRSRRPPRLWRRSRIASRACRRARARSPSRSSPSPASPQRLGR
jgi:hypothetical protein